MQRCGASQGRSLFPGRPQQQPPFGTLWAVTRPSIPIILPPALRSAVVRVQSGMQEEHALAATRLVLRSDSVRNALFLASTEFAELEGSLPWDDLRRLPSFTAYLAEGDMWCPAWQQQLLEKVYWGGVKGIPAPREWLSTLRDGTWL